MISTPQNIRARNKYESLHESRIAERALDRAADSIRQRLPHGAKGAFNRTFSQMVKHLLKPSKTGKAVCTFDHHNRVLPGDELPTETLRRLSIYDFISAAVASGNHELALDVAELAKYAPESDPFEFSRLDAWRMVIDFMHGDDLYRRGFNVVSKREAKQQKLPTYFTNEPCTFGNFAMRRTSDSACLCLQCADLRAGKARGVRARSPGKNGLTCKAYRVRKVMRELHEGAA